MTRGRKPKPAILRNLEGNPGKRAIEDFGVEASGEVFVPEHLPQAAMDCIELVKANMPFGVYAAMDSFLLSAFATAWAIHRRAAIEIGAPDFQYVKGGMVNPWLHILNAQARMLAQLGDRIGLSPAARAQLRMPDTDRPPSKFQGLLGMRAMQ